MTGLRKLKAGTRREPLTPSRASHHLGGTDQRQRAEPFLRRRRPANNEWIWKLGKEGGHDFQIAVGVRDFVESKHE